MCEGDKVRKLATYVFEVDGNAYCGWGRNGWGRMGPALLVDWSVVWVGFFALTNKNFMREIANDASKHGKVETEKRNFGGRKIETRIEISKLKPKFEKFSIPVLFWWFNNVGRFPDPFLPPITGINSSYFCGTRPNRVLIRIVSIFPHLNTSIKINFFLLSNSPGYLDLR